jgi:hypothetical protein
MGDIMSESMGGIISECPGDFIGIGTAMGLGKNITPQNGGLWP